MLKLIRTSSIHSEFKKLTAELDQLLIILNGDSHDFFAQFNKIDVLQHCIVAYYNGIACGCGAVKEISPGVMEVKRMYVMPEFRKKGIAQAVLAELERWSAEMDYTSCVLETAKALTEANSLYNKAGYKVIPNYGQYAGIETSICYEKKLAVSAE